MGTFIITVALIGLFSYVFQLFWKALLKFLYYLLLGAIDIIKKVITFARRAGKAIVYLYKRYKNGKIVRYEYKEEEIDIDLLPEGVREQFEEHDEVVVKNTDIQPEEFE